MANFGTPPVKNKKGNRLGVPPSIKDSSANLEAPEHAPLSPDNFRKARNKTGRTIPFSTKVSKEFNEAFRETAFKAKLKHAELLEIMLEMYKKQN